MPDPLDNPSKDVDKGHSHHNHVGVPNDIAPVSSGHVTTPPAGATFDPSPSSPRTPLPRVGSSGSTQFKTPKRDRTLYPKDTPLSVTVSARRRALDTKKSEVMHMRYADEARKWMVGPMPVEEFLTTFLSESEFPEKDDAGRSIPDPTDAFAGVPSEPGPESQLYQPLIESINDYDRCPSVKFYNTSTRALQPGKGSLKPDSCGYHDVDLDAVRDESGNVAADLGHAEIFLEVKAEKSKDPFHDPPDDLQDPDALEKHEFIKIGKLNSNLKPVDDESKSLRDASIALGQNVSYAVDAFARQHRMFYFSIFIIGTYARFIRWDRSGAVVSRAFDYKCQPKYLCDFLWRFGLATPEQRGYDPTVVKATQAEEAIFLKAIRPEVAFQLNIDATTNARKLNQAVRYHYTKGKVSKLYVYDKSHDTFDQFLVSRPTISPMSLAGRSTRGYWSVRLNGDNEASDVNFIKDTWRITVDRMDPEGHAYADLNGHAVTNVGTMVCQGDIWDGLGFLGESESEESQDGFQSSQKVDEDTEPNADYAETFAESRIALQNVQPGVGHEDDSNKSQPTPPVPQTAAHPENAPSGAFGSSDQGTRTGDFVRASWSCRGGRRVRVFKHTHYRLVLKEAGYPLSWLTGTRELFEATYDVLIAIIEANEKCGRLHRDISVDNIILVRDRKTGRRKGILIDWELSTKTDRGGRARDYDRSGTWAFMSEAALSASPNFRHSIADDMESLLYVVLYCCARWVPHNPIEDLGELMASFFDMVERIGENLRGGYPKAFQKRWRHFTSDFSFLNTAIGDWISSIYDLLAPLEPGVLANWVPSAVKEVWEDMLNCDLSDGDRVEHKVGDVIGEMPQYSATHTTHESSRITSGSSKRHANNDVAELERSSKRRRADMTEGNEPVDNSEHGGRE